MPLTVEQLLERQCLVISRAQAREAGMSVDAWRHRFASGRWQRCGDGVGIAHSGEPQPEQLNWAAVLHCGAAAALTGDAALVRFGAKRLTLTAHDVAVEQKRKPVRRELPLLTVIPHRLLYLEKWSAEHDHLRLVNAHAATLHAAAWAADDEAAEHRIALAVQQRLTTPVALHSVLPQMPRLPRLALITTVLADVEHGATARSELDFLRFCRRNALPEPDALQLSVRAGTSTCYVDAHYKRQRVFLEIDGAHHRWVAEWEADTMRTLQLAVARRDTGERVHRVTPAMTRHHELETAALLRALLA